MSPLRANPPQRLFLLLAAAASASLAPAASLRAGDSVVLKPKFDKPGEAYVEFDTDAVQKFAGPDGNTMEMKVRSVYGLIQKAAGKGDEVVLDMTLDRLLGFMSFGESMKTLYDTDDPLYEDASPMHRDAFAPILNMPLKITLGAGGRATAVVGGEAIRKKLLDLGEGNFVAKSVAEADLTDRQIMSNFAEVPMVLFANREVKVGETWKKTQTDEFPQVGKVLLSFDCKLDRVEKVDGREIAFVSFAGSVAKDPDEKPAEGKRLGKIDGSFTGTARFDVAQGRFVEIVRKAKAELQVPPFWTKDPNAPMMKIDSASTMKFTAAPAAERRKHKADIARRVADAEAKRKVDEAAAMAGPTDPVTPANDPVPWLQWGGPNRDFSSDATGLANRWPKDGPPKLWERPLGDGFSSILCDGDALYTMYSVRDKDDPFKGDEVVVALDARTGKTLWEHKYPAPWPKGLQMEFGPGPHSTPAVVGDRVFSVGCTAILTCLDRKTGKPVWSKDLHEEYKAGLLGRGYGASPLAYKGNILLPVSKEKGHAVMAFRQSDGTVAWKAGDFEPGYASLLAIETDGIEQIVAFTGNSLAGIDPVSGGRTWNIEHPTQWGANISTPVWCPEDKHLFISSAYGMGARGVKLEQAGSQVAAKEVWFNPKIRVMHGDAVRVGEWVYASSGDFGPSFLSSVNARTGEIGWRQRGIAKANVVYADGKLIVLDEDGDLYLLKADPAKYRLLAKAPGMLKKTAWTVPTLYGRTLYVRDRERIIALDLGPAKSST